MKIEYFYQDSSKPHFSFEFFPPKTPGGEENLFRTIRKLKDLKPEFVSITHGAGSSAFQKTLKWTIQIKSDIQIESMAHLICYGSRKEKFPEILKRLQENNIDNVLALRGDTLPSERGDKDVKLQNLAETYFTHASDLIHFIKTSTDMSIGGAIYPEIHPEAESPEKDLEYALLKQKNGIGFFITQLFFDNRNFFTFVKRAQKAGITVPIIPGIMPITNYSQIQKFVTLCGATVPQELMEKMDSIRGDENAILQEGIRHSTNQCVELLKRGVKGIHFYTLNKSKATIEIFQKLKKFI
jgi:methylenetetrahydrofolate reductase (NADPH)